MIRFRAGYKYQLAEPYAVDVGIVPPGDTIVTSFLCLSVRGTLYISGGYAWDGATGFPDIKSIQRGALIHDALYQLIRLGYLPSGARTQADLILWRCCLEDGMWSWLAKAVLLAVQRFGGAAADPRNAKPIMVAP